MGTLVTLSRRIAIGLILFAASLPLTTRANPGTSPDTNRAHQQLLQAAANSPLNPETGRYYRVAAGDFLEAGFSARAGHVLLQGGRHHFEYGKFDLAEAFFQEALALGSPDLPLGLELEMRMGHAKNLIAQEKFAEALTELRRAEKRVGDRPLRQAAIWCDMGTCLSELNDVRGALEHFSRARGLAESHPNGHRELARVLLGLGWHYFENRDLELSLPYHRQSAEIGEQHLAPDDPLLGRLFLDLAGILSVTRHHDESLVFLEKARTVWQSAYVHWHPNLVEVHHNLAFNFECDRQYEQAVKHYREALSLWRQNAEPEGLGQVILLNNLGRCHRKLRQFESARNAYQQALALGKSLFGELGQYVAYSYQQLGATHAEAGDTTLALRNYHSALLASVRGFDDPNPRSQPATLRSDHITNVPHDLLEILKGKGELLADRGLSASGQPGDLEAAMETFELAIRLMDDLRLQGMVSLSSKTGLVTSMMPLFDRAINSAYRLWALTGNDDYLERAFWFSEKSKAYVLLASLRESDARAEAQVNPDWLRQEQQLLTSLADCEGKIRSAGAGSEPEQVQLEAKWLQLKEELGNLQRELEVRHPKYHRLKYNLNPATLSELSEAIEPNQTLVEYFLGQHDLHLFVVRSDTTGWLSVPVPRALDTAVFEFRSLLTSTGSSQEAFAEMAAELYTQLLQPIEQLTGDRIAGRLILVPDGVLGFVPFDLLLSQVPKSGTGFRDLPYLFRDADVSYQYSATLVLEARSTPPALHADRFLALAPKVNRVLPADQDQTLIASRLRSEGLEPLYYSREEVVGIGSSLPGDTFTGHRATEALFKGEAPNYGILHLATHALIDDESPMFSRLVLNPGPDSAEDGFLHVHELFGLQLHAELAVLSACNTGYGKLIRGEGVMSMARGFLHAGCRSILMTRWEANDFSTSVLMQGFYHHLREGLPKDEALRQARLDYLAKADGPKAHPFYWGGFALIGDQRALLSASKSEVEADQSWNWVLGMLAFLTVGFGVIRFWVRPQRLRSWSKSDARSA